MITSSNKISRRQAIGFAAACCCGIGVDPVNAAQRSESPINLRRRIRSLHLELLLFNRELVPQFLTDRDEHTADKSQRARRFLAVSLYMRRLLDQRGSGAPVSIDEVKLSDQLQKLNVSPSLACQSQHSWMRQRSDVGLLSNETTETGHSFIPSSQSAHSHRIEESAMRLCTALKQPANAHRAVETVRNASDDDLRTSFESTAPMTYLELVEPLFLIRPTTPASLLTLHSRVSTESERFRSMLTAICGSLMERLAHEHFHQTLAIGHLQQCEGRRQPSTLGNVFSVLLEKWLLLMRDGCRFQPGQ